MAISGDVGGWLLVAALAALFGLATMLEAIRRNSTATALLGLVFFGLAFGCWSTASSTSIGLPGLGTVKEVLPPVETPTIPTAGPPISAVENHADCTLGVTGHDALLFAVDGHGCLDFTVSADWTNVDTASAITRAAGEQVACYLTRDIGAEAILVMDSGAQSYGGAMCSSLEAQGFSPSD